MPVNHDNQQIQMCIMHLMKKRRCLFVIFLRTERYGRILGESSPGIRMEPPSDNTMVDIQPDIFHENGDIGCYQKVKEDESRTRVVPGDDSWSVRCRNESRMENRPGSGRPPQTGRSSVTSVTITAGSCKRRPADAE